MDIKRISAKDTYYIRRKTFNITDDEMDELFWADEEETNFHLGAFIEGQLSSVASFYFNKNQDIADQNQFELRGMATLPEHQRKGISSELLKVAFPIIKQNFCTIVWCITAEDSKPFYERVGFEHLKDVAPKEGSNKTKVMYKRIG